MSLYIPPYVKPPVSSTANPVPALQPSSSFANLGIPPAHRQQTVRAPRNFVCVLITSPYRRRVNLAIRPHTRLNHPTISR